MRVAIAQRAFLDDPHNGDQCAYWQSGPNIMLCVVDGLGHGKDAEDAAKAAVDYVGSHLSDPLPAIFAGCDSAIRHTRGVAMGLAVINEDTETLTFAGIGNTRLLIIGKKRVALSSDPGIVGGGYKAIYPETQPKISGDLVVMYTDGLQERTDMSDYGATLVADIQLLAERLLKDWGGETDDAAVLIFLSG